MKQTFYVTDEKTNDFATTVKNLKPLPENYEYHKNTISYKIFKFLGYSVIMRPIAYLYIKIKFAQKFVGKNKFKDIKGGMFFYVNHTLKTGDAFLPNLIDFTRHNYILTGEQANSLTWLLPLMRIAGSIPVGETPKSLLKTKSCIEKRIKEGASITIYPEAHVWPYYTKIRNFSHVSMKFPTITNAPVFAVTNCF